MTSNDSGVESSTDNDECAQPQLSQKLVSCAETALVSTSKMKNEEFPLALCLNTVSEPLVFAKPLLDEIPGRKLKCLFELANPSFPGPLDRFQSCLTPIQEYTEMLLEMEKKNSSNSRSNAGPCRVHPCKGYSYIRKKALHIRDSHRLCRAASMNNTELLEQMLKNGVNPNCWDSRKRTPLHLAACKGYTEAVRLLLKYGANPNIKDSLGNNPLHLAACTHHMEVVTLLLKGGTDVSSCDAQGRSPLHLAQSKLRLLTQCRSDTSTSVKETVLQVIDMLLAYFEKQKGSSDESELLNVFQNRLKISDTEERVSSELQDLLNNISNLKLNK
ncbi:ankyrin repeat domain-containing protein 54-like [Daktulosphaira vitifoliae]|uniref:ankyrin repeat domain-containing protein 54-like n=1 Tax=Daktulosphaira vitifoliae TaxID=58002 RepID=UPI0021AAA847|nr:ankyrin repeat domain-containing protein 54-like [Daktulosphaira vitifoliae]